MRVETSTDSFPYWWLVGRICGNSSSTCFDSVALMLDLTSCLRILYASQSEGFIVMKACFKESSHLNISSSISAVLTCDFLYFFVPEWFDRHLLFENVKEQLVKRWHLIIDLVWNTNSALGALWDVYAKGLCVKVLKTVSHYGGRNRFWMLQSLVNTVKSSQHSYARIRRYSYVLSIIFPFMPLHENWDYKRNHNFKTLGFTRGHFMGEELLKASMYKVSFI